MVMSIVHRITGGALYFGTLLLAWWLLAAASGPNAYATFQWFMGKLIGRLVLFGYTWALIHHMLGGIRHLIWDTGRGFGAAEREWLARATLSARSRSRCCCGSSAIWSWGARDERRDAHAAGRVRGLGSAHRPAPRTSGISA